jgi:NADH-quinone oxidoreductase subunit L
MTHAFFKALLFLGAGSVIHAMGGEQDIRKMGGIKKQMPITYITFFIGCLAIAGIPPFAGFFSKDEILAGAFAKNPVLYAIGLGGALLTAFYMFRLLAMTFTGKFRGTEEQAHHLHESPSPITIPLICLAILSIVGGLIGIPEIFMHNGHRLEEYLSPVFAQSNAILLRNEIPHQTEYILTGVSSLLIIITCIWAWSKYKKYQLIAEEDKGFAKVLANKWYVDEIYDALIVRPLKAISVFFNNIIEKSGIDGIVNGIGKSVNYGSRQVRLLQNGQTGFYILMMIIGIIVLFIIQLYSK